MRSQTITSPKESRRWECPSENTEATGQAAGRGDRAGAVGSEQAHLAATAPSCPSPFSIDTNTSPKGGKPKHQQSTTRSRSCPPLPPHSLACPRPLPQARRGRLARPGPLRDAGSLGSKASPLVLLFSFIKRGGETPVAVRPAHTPPPSNPDKSRCTLTSDSSTSSPRELSDAVPATRALRVVLFLLLRLIYFRSRRCSR